MQVVDTLAADVGVVEACEALGVPRSHYYRARARSSAGADTPEQTSRPRPRSPRALSEDEQARVLALLRSERFCDLAPREVYATLLDEGEYLCHWSTMYRLLRQVRESTRRRDHPRRHGYRKPELLARRPNQLWSWDITKLKGPATWTYFYLYVVIDVFSRYVVGWMLATRESAELAEALIGETCAREGIERGQLTIHADRGSSMRSKEVAQLLVDLGVEKSHSRPYVSNDNPFSEAAFKTAKYHPSTPERFSSVEEGRAWAKELFGWYNHEHHHVNLALLTPAQVHQGLTARVLAARKRVLAGAYAKHPERFVRGEPSPAAPPSEVWINPPSADVASSTAEASNPAPVLPLGGGVSRGYSAAALDAPPPSGYPGQGEARQLLAGAVDAP
jgi:putative transposase